MKNRVIATLIFLILLAGCGQGFHAGRTTQAKNHFPPPPPFGVKVAAQPTDANDEGDDEDEADEAEAEASERAEERESADDARKYFLLRRTGREDGELPVEKYEQARAHVARMGV